MQGGGGGSLAVVAAEADDGGAADETADPVASAVDAAGAGAGDEEGGDSAGGGVPPPHAPTSEALAIDSPRRHGSVQAQDDQERIRHSLVENSASASGAACAPRCRLTTPLAAWWRPGVVPLPFRNPRVRVPHFWPLEVGARPRHRRGIVAAGRQRSMVVVVSVHGSLRQRGPLPQRQAGRLCGGSA
jgi:hypothetical protein